MAEKRRHYTAAFKRKVIRFAEKNYNSAAGRVFGVSECNVRRWRHDSIKIFSCVATRNAFSGPQKGKYEELETNLNDFVISQRAKGLPISSEIFQVKAKKIARTSGILRTEFGASRSWVQKFMAREGFSLRRRTSSCQKLPPNVEEKLVELN